MRSGRASTAKAVDSEQCTVDRVQRIRMALHVAGIVGFTSAATAVMLLCPCDSVGLRDHFALSLVGAAALCGLGAAWFIFRLMRKDSGDTVFLRAFVALAIAGAAIYAELFVAMQAVAWMARLR